ncbi:DUF3298 and DUF4163 domain-containing protein [Lachnospiraceae bacterium JLR.KK008]
MKRKMKQVTNKKWMAVWAVCLAVMLTGCGKEEGTPGNEEQTQQTDETQESVQETESEAVQEPETESDTEQASELAVQIRTTQKEEIKNEEGTVLLTSDASEVSVTIPGNAQAQEAVNQFFKDLQKSYRSTVSEHEESAAKDLDFRKEEGIENWFPYEIGRYYEVKRVDEQMISIVETSYEYTGGAHPNSVKVAYNFDTQTGQRMTLEDVASDLDEIRTKSVEYLGQMLPQSQYADELFEDYAGHLEDILTDSTWYTDELGFHIICNEYIITPHSSGILDFVLPYDEVDVVAGAYIPASAAGQPAESSEEPAEDTTAGTEDAAGEQVQEETTE